MLLGGAGTGSLEITVHESQCGARTTACALCNKFVQLKDVRVHMATHKQLKQFENRGKII